MLKEIRQMPVDAILDRFDPLQKQLEALLENPEDASQRFPYSYVMLPDILGSLKQLQRSLSQQPIDIERCRLHAAGFGRLVMEYIDLPDSDLGDQLLGLASDVIQMTK
jgi:hypothetical protein